MVKLDNNIGNKESSVCNQREVVINKSTGGIKLRNASIRSQNTNSFYSSRSNNKLKSKD